MGITIDLIVIFIFILNIINGYKKGLVNVVFNICAFLIAIIATLILYKPISNIVINNTDIDEKIKEIIINNNISDENKDDKEKTSLEQYVERTIQDTTNETKKQTTEVIADTISNKAVQIITGIGLFIVIRIVLTVLKFLTESIAELPIIKQFNQTGGIIYGILKSLIIIYVILTILFFIVSIKGNGIITDAIDSSCITKFLYENNIIVNYCLLEKNLL